MIKCGVPAVIELLFDPKIRRRRKCKVIELSSLDSDNK